MLLKNQKGVVGTDIAIAIVVLFIFVSLIAVLIFNFNVSSKEGSRKTVALELAMNEIDDLKHKDFNTLEDSIVTRAETGREGFVKTIDVVDYADLAEDKLSGIVKKVTVTIEYKESNDVKSVELSSIITKEYL